MKRIVIPVVVVFLCGLALVVVWSKSGTASREQQIAVVESGVSAATQQCRLAPVRWLDHERWSPLPQPRRENRNLQHL